MAYVTWTEETYPSNTNYDATSYITWLKGFFTKFNEAMIGVGMEFINTTFVPDNFSLPAMMTGTANGTTSTIATFVYKYPQGTGLTEFELNESGEYYDIVSNDHDNTKCYLKIYFGFFKTNTNVSVTNRYQREQLWAFFQHSNTLNESNTNNLVSALTLYQQKFYMEQSTSTYYSGYLMFSDLSCHVALTENELHIQLFSGAYMNSKGSNYSSIPQMGLLELYTYRENNNLIAFGYSTSNDTNVGGNTNKYHYYLSILDLSFENSVYYYNYTKWCDDNKMTYIDNYGEYTSFQINAPIRVNQNENCKNGYLPLPNVVIIHQNHITQNKTGVDVIVKYKGYPVKRKFFPPNNANWIGMNVSSGYTANSSVATFGFYRGI